VCADARELLSLTPALVVEMGGHAALRCHAPGILRAGVDVLALSVGALADQDTERTLLEAACVGRSQLSVVSGGSSARTSLAGPKCVIAPSCIATMASGS